MLKQVDRRGDGDHPHLPWPYAADHLVPGHQGLLRLEAFGLIVGETGDHLLSDSDEEAEYERLSAPGVPAAHVRETIESTLRDRGIALLADDQCLSTRGEPHLFVWIEREIGARTGWVRADLRELVRLERDPLIQVRWARTWWGVEAFPTGDTDDTRELLGAVDQAIVALLSQFCEDHRAANAEPAASVAEDEE